MKIAEWKKYLRISILFFCGVLVFGVWLVSRTPAIHKTENQMKINPEKTIIVGGDELSVAVADSSIEQQQGLAGVTDLYDDEGMLFVFSDSTVRSFWMKGMRIPIDIIWIQDGVLVGYVDHVPVEDGVPLYQLQQYQSPVPVQYVLEVRAGLRAEKGWDIGTEVRGLD